MKRTTNATVTVLARRQHRRGWQFDAHPMVAAEVITTRSDEHAKDTSFPPHGSQIAGLLLVGYEQVAFIQRRSCAPA
jgi:hypothetical protein